MKVRIPKEDTILWGVVKGTLSATDLCYLLALREEEFGANRLKQVIHRAAEIDAEYRDKNPSEYKAEEHEDTEKVSYELLEWDIAEADLCYLLAIHEYGYGETRLERISECGRNIYTQYRDRYCTDKDVKRVFVNSPHLLAMREELESCGFNYSEETEKLNDYMVRRLSGNNKNAPHIVSMAEALKSYGFDYFRSIRMAEQRQKYRWYGNKSLVR